MLGLLVPLEIEIGDKIVMMNRLHDHKRVGCQPGPVGLFGWSWKKNQSEKGDVDQMALKLLTLQMKEWDTAEMKRFVLHRTKLGP